VRRATGVLVGLALLVGGGLGTGLAARAADAPAFAYPGARELPLGDDLRLNGVPLRATYFVTRDPAVRVASFYRQALARAGLHVSEVLAPGNVTLLGLTPSGEARFSVSIHAQAERTLVFPSRAAAEKLALPPTARPGSAVPVYPGATGLTALTARDHGGVTETVVYRDRAGLARNLEYFRTEMARRGWRVDERVTGVRGPTAVLRFRRDGRTCTVGLTWDAEASQTQVTATTSGGGAS